MSLAPPILVYDIPLTPERRARIASARQAYEDLQFFDLAQLVVLNENQQRLIFYVPEFELEALTPLLANYVGTFVLDIHHRFQPLELRGTYVRIQRTTNGIVYA